MFIRFTRDIILTVYTHDVITERDRATLYAFGCGEMVQIGEVSPTDTSTTIELLGYGYADIPDEAWVVDDYLSLN